MRRFISFFTLLLVLASTSHAQAKQAALYAAMAPAEQYLIANPENEIALARSAAPPAISADADVLVLGTHGYQTAVKGKNGFVCFVERSWTANFGNPEFWNPKLRAPNCFNPPAVRSVLPQYLKRTEWAMAGLSEQQISEKARSAFMDQTFTAPDPGSLSYMLSKDGYVSDQAAGPWLPHVMFFISYGQAAAWGAGVAGSPILAQAGSDFEPTVLFIPVRRWSDGSPAPPPADLHTH